MQVKLISVTPDAEKHMGYVARVSNPANQDNPKVAGLLSYCIKHQHWSVFEQAFMTLEIETTRGLASKSYVTVRSHTKNFHNDMLTVLCWQRRSLCLIFDDRIQRIDRTLSMILILSLSKSLRFRFSVTWMLLWICMKPCLSMVSQKSVQDLYSPSPHPPGYT